MEYHFNVEVATEFDVNSSIFMQNIVYWCLHNEANNKNFLNGRHWTYNTNEAFRKLFPFWSKGQIERIISKCVSSNLLLVEINNTDNMDRTRSFALTDYAISIYRKQEMQIPKMGRTFPENEKCYKETDRKPNGKQGDNTPSDELWFGTSQLVHMTKTDYEKLLLAAPKEAVMDKIENLDCGIANGDSKYTKKKNHYRTILNWLRGDGLLYEQNEKKNQSFDFDAEGLL